MPLPRLSCLIFVAGSLVYGTNVALQYNEVRYYGIGLYLLICLRNVNGKVRAGPTCVDSAGETITADPDATQEGEDVVAKDGATAPRWGHFLPLHLLLLVLRLGLRLLFRQPNQRKLVQI